MKFSWRPRTLAGTFSKRSSACLSFGADVLRKATYGLITLPFPNCSKRLCEEVEGSVSDTTGIIVAVMQFQDEQDVKRGIIEYEVGTVCYSYSLLRW